MHSLHSKETFSPIAIKIQTRPVVGDLIHSDFVPTAWVPNGSKSECGNKSDKIAFYHRAEIGQLSFYLWNIGLKTEI